MIDGDVEETLDLVGVEVHGDEAVDACRAQEVGDELGADAHARLVLAVLASPSEVGDDGVDLTCGRTLGCVDHEQQLHEVVGVGEGALNEEYILAADTLLIAYHKLSVGELRSYEVAKRHS